MRVMQPRRPKVGTSVLFCLVRPCASFGRHLPVSGEMAGSGCC